MAEKSSLGTRQTDGKKLGLVWRNRKKISQIINAYLYLPFFLLFYEVNNLQIPLKMFLISPWPALEGGDDKEGEHGVQDVVVVKARPLPHPLFNCNRGKSVGWYKQRRLSASSFRNQVFIYPKCMYGNTLSKQQSLFLTEKVISAVPTNSNFAKVWFEKLAKSVFARYVWSKDINFWWLYEV